MSRYPFYFALPPHASTTSDLDAARVHIATKYDVHGPATHVRDDHAGWALYKIAAPWTTPASDPIVDAVLADETFLNNVRALAKATNK